jgi:hypothetical protein
MRRFYLFRKEDATGMSGTGRVADGVEFSNGMCTLTWKSEVPTITVFTSISSVRKLHTHDGQHDTKIMYVDPPDEDVEARAVALLRVEADAAAAAADEHSEEDKDTKPTKKKTRTTKKKTTKKEETP